MTRTGLRVDAVAHYGAVASEVGLLVVAGGEVGRDPVALGQVGAQQIVEVAVLDRVLELGGERLQPSRDERNPAGHLSPRAIGQL